MRRPFSAAKAYRVALDDDSKKARRFAREVKDRTVPGVVSALIKKGADGEKLRRYIVSQ